jgi:hypothetical protein
MEGHMWLALCESRPVSGAMHCFPKQQLQLHAGWQLHSLVLAGRKACCTWPLFSWLTSADLYIQLQATSSTTPTLHLQAALLARGRVVRQAKLLFYAKMAEKGLATYERDGWGDFPTQIHPDRREIRPTADRGPILLCVDTSGE